MKIDEFPTLFLPSQNALLTLLAYRCRLNAAYLPPYIDADGRDVLEDTEPNPPARPKSSASPCPLLLTPSPTEMSVVDRHLPVFVRAYQQPAAKRNAGRRQRAPSALARADSYSCRSWTLPGN